MPASSRVRTGVKGCGWFCCQVCHWQIQLLLAENLSVQVAANKLRDVTGSCYPAQGLWRLIKQISYCCLCTSSIKFLVKTLGLCFSLSFEDVLVLLLLTSDSSSNSLRPLGVDRGKKTFVVAKMLLTNSGSYYGRALIMF